LIFFYKFLVENVGLYDIVNGLDIAFENNKIEKRESKSDIWSPRFELITESHLTYDTVFTQLEKFKFFKDKIYVSDIDFSCVPALQIKCCDNNSFFNQILYSQKGYAIKAAIGIQKAMEELKLDKRIAIFIGESGVQNAIQSISTLIENKSNAIIFSFNDGVKKLDNWLVNPKSFEKKETIPDFFKNRDWNYINMVKSMGGEGFKVYDHEDFLLMLSKNLNL